MDIKQIRKTRPIGDLINFSFINIDKPTGPTSFQISHYVGKYLKASKSAHLGTLDPQVTGVLPIALGRACRLNDYFMHRNKTYVGIMRLHKEVSEKDLKDEIKKFIGKISQLPPVRSKVKRALREREIVSFDIKEIDGKDVLFHTEVQAGTYIRKLIHDLGENLGGAHMLELRRIQAGIFAEDELYTLYELDKAIAQLNAGNESTLREMLIPAEIILTLFKTVKIKAEYVKKCYAGSPVMKSYLEEKASLKDGENICVVSGDKFIGVYKVKQQNDIVAMPEFVLN